MDDIIIRNIETSETNILKDFLYLALCKEGLEKPKKNIINNPSYKDYYIGFGMDENDCGLVAEYKGRIIGAIWARKAKIIDYYTHYDSIIAISILEEYRGNKVGTKLMYKMLLLLLEHDYKNISFTLKKDDSTICFFKKFKFNYNPKSYSHNNDEYIFSLNIYDFFRYQVRIYSLESKRYKMLINEPYQYTDDEVSFFIMFLLHRNEIKENLVRFDTYDGYINSNETLQNTENDYIREELLRRKVEKAKDIIEKARKLKGGKLKDYNYEALLETRQRIIQDKSNKKNKGSICCDGSGGRKPFTARQIEKMDRDKKLEEIIASTQERTSYVKIYDLIRNYMNLYDLTENDLKERSGLSGSVLYDIRKERTKQKKKTILQLCIGLGLTTDQAILFMQVCGYAFSTIDDIDNIVYTCLERGDVDHISEVNDILLEFGFDEEELFKDYMDYDIRKKRKK